MHSVRVWQTATAPLPQVLASQPRLLRSTLAPGLRPTPCPRHVGSCPSLRPSPVSPDLQSSSESWTQSWFPPARRVLVSARPPSPGFCPLGRVLISTNSAAPRVLVSVRPASPGLRPLSQVLVSTCLAARRVLVSPCLANPGLGQSGESWSPSARRVLVSARPMSSGLRPLGCPASPGLRLPGEPSSKPARPPGKSRSKQFKSAPPGWVAFC